MRIIKKNLLYLVAICLTNNFFLGCNTIPQLNEKPNILFIIVDDLGWTDLGTGSTNYDYGSDYYETPNVDWLAENGMAFTNAYATGPNCAPTRAALMSGQYANRTKMYTVHDPNRGEEVHRKLIASENKEFLDLDQVTLAEALKNVGYATGHFGKWHLGGHLGGGLPDEQGFDINIGGTNVGGSTGGFFSNNIGAYPGNPLMPGLEPNGIENEWLDDRITGEAIKFIEQNDDKPFFVHLSFFAVHTPISAPKADFDYFNDKPKTKHHNNQTYAGFVKSFDNNIGRLIEYLETTHDPIQTNKKLIDNTLIIFYSDNGGLGGYERSGIDGWNFTSQYPLRDGKGSLKEGGIRVPLIAYWKNQISVNAINHLPVTTVDFYPTLLALSNTKIPDNKILDGINLLPVLRGQDYEINRDLFWHFPAYLEAYQKDVPNFRTTPVSIIRSGDWKLLYYYESKHWELYNLTTDIGENQNVASENQSVVNNLGKRLVDWLIETKADMPKGKETGQSVGYPILPF